MAADHLETENEAEAKGASEPESEPIPEPDPSDKSASAPAGGGAGSRGLGVIRYVQFAFLGAGAILLWLLDKLVTAIWDMFAEPPPVIVTILAGVISAVTMVAVYRTERVYSLANEVATELSKVTWPTRKETYYSTVVVLIASTIAAVIVFVFDAIWSFLTDKVY